MAFDPDAYLAQTESVPALASSFDPDAYLAQGAAPVAESETPVEAPQRVNKLKLPEKAPRLSGDGSAASYIKQGTRSGLQGATLGWSDEIGAAVAAPIYKAGEMVGLLPETNQPVFVSEEGNPSLYSQMQGRSDAEQKQFAKDYPVADIAGQVGGGLIPAALTGGQTVAAQTLPQLAKQGAIQGAKYGGAYGAGTSEQGFTNRLTGGGIGATIGALTGGTVAPLINVAGNTAGALKNAYQEMVTRTPRQKAEMLLQGVAKEAGYTPEQLATRVTGLGKQGTLADASENMLSVADQAVSKIGTTKEAARELVKTRNKGEQADVLAVLGKQLGVNSADDIAVAIEKNAAERTAKASPLYKQSLSSTVPESEAFEKLRALPDFQKFLRAGTKLAENDIDRVTRQIDPLTGKATGKFMPAVRTEAERLQDAKEASYAQELAHRMAGDTNAASLVAKTRNRITEVLDTLPGYAEARQTWAGSKAMDNASEVGRSFFKLTENPDEFINAVKGMTPSEREFAQMAMMKAATDKAGAASGNRSIARTLIGEDGNVNRKKMLAALAGDDAVKELEANAAKWARFRRTSNRFEGSQTHERGQTEAALDGMEAVTNPKGFVMNKLMETLSPFGRRMNDSAVTNELGNILMAQGVPESEIIRLLTPAPVRQQVIGKATGQVLLPAEQVLLDRALQ